MILGFTGTSHYGPTIRQSEAMKRFIRNIGVTRFVHGGAHGSDTLAHHAVRACYPDIVIEIHPCPLNSGSTVWVPMGNCEIYPDLPPLDRNRVIVRRIHGLLATPRTDIETIGSGTWATVRYAREAGVPIYIATTDGRLVRDPTTFDKWLRPL